MGDVWEVQPATVLAAGKFVGDGKRLDADVSAGRDFVFYVPNGRYQLLRFRAQLFAVPSSVGLSQRTLPVYTRFAGDNDIYGFWHLDDDSWMHDLLYGRERWVVLRYEIVARPLATVASPDLRVVARFARPTWSKGEPSKQQVDRLFDEPAPNDSSEPFADSEVVLGDAVAATARDHAPPACSGAP
jgi:hypothetical protein